MTPEDRRQAVAELEPDALFADGFDAALIGVVTIFNRTVALYDHAQCRLILEEQGLTSEEADEHLSVNVLGGYHGLATPGFATFIPGVQVLVSPRQRRCANPECPTGWFTTGRSNKRFCSVPCGNTSRMRRWRRGLPVSETPKA